MNTLFLSSLSITLSLQDTVNLAYNELYVSIGSL